MEFITALTILGTMLGIVSVIGAALGYILRSSPNSKFQGLHGLSRGIMFSLLVAALVGQYFLAPATSLFTFLPAVPFPGSTLHACSVQRTDLPSGPVAYSTAPLRLDVAGKSLTISGSSVLYSLIAHAGAEFDAQNSTTTSVAKLNSEEGLQDVIAGRAQIGLSDIYAEDDADPNVVESGRGLLDYQLAVSPFTLLVSDDLHQAIQNLTTSQIIDIFSGKLTNWHAIGGPDEPITVYNRKLGSGTRVIFEKYVLGFPVPNDDLRARTTQGLITLLARTPGSIGYAATSSIVHDTHDAIFPVCIDGVGATTANINSGRYMFWNYEHAYIKAPSDITLAFLQYICGHDFQTKDLPGAGFLTLNQLSGTAVALHADDYPPSQQCGS
jgi:phosphate transport system substrate-binding protein